MWWHTSLYHLDAEDTSKVLEIYDTRIWGLANLASRRAQELRTRYQASRQVAAPI